MPSACPPFLEIIPHGPASRVVVSSPHGGRYYPASLLAQAGLGEAALAALEDGPTELWAADCAKDGASVLVARYARAFVDLNRSPREVDAALLEQHPAARALQRTARVAVGLGVVPSQVAARAIYPHPLGLAAIRQRLRLAYLPYHRRLALRLRERARQLGSAVLLDCHSMPVEVARAPGLGGVDVALGDRFGTSADPLLVEAALAALAGAGLKALRNQPYAGGFITEHHGRPARGRHALQLEVRRDLFMDPRSRRPHAGLAAVATAVRALAATLDAAAANLGPSPAAAPVDRPMAETLQAAM